MTDIVFSAESVRKAAAELKNIQAEWMREAEDISSECREKMIHCGNIINEYAELLDNICSEYENAENEAVRVTGE